MSVMTAVREIFTKREQDKALSYSQTVMALGEDQDIDPAKVAKLLDSTHTTYEKLEANVELYKARKAAILQLERCEAARQESRQLENEISALDQEIKQWLEPKHQKAKELSEQLTAAERIAHSDGSIVRRLIETAPPVFTERVEAITKERATVVKRLEFIRENAHANLNSLVKELEQKAYSYQLAINNGRNPADRERTLLFDDAKIQKPLVDAQLVEATAQREKLRGEMGELSEQLATHEAQLAKLNAMKLEVWPVLED